jgi:hypothetical protein
MRCEKGGPAPEWEWSLFLKLEITEADKGNVPIMVWCISSLDIERGGWKWISKTKSQKCKITTVHWQQMTWVWRSMSAVRKREEIRAQGATNTRKEPTS